MKLVLKLVTVTNFFASLVLSGAVLAAPDEDLLGKRDGYPVCRQLILGSQDQRCYVGNLSHSDEVAPFRVVKAGTPRQFRQYPLHSLRHPPRDSRDAADLNIRNFSGSSKSEPRKWATR